MEEAHKLLAAKDSIDSGVDGGGSQRHNRPRAAEGPIDPPTENRLGTAAGRGTRGQSKGAKYARYLISCLARINIPVRP